MSFETPRSNPLMLLKIRNVWRHTLLILCLLLVAGLPLAEIFEYSLEAETFSREWHLGLGAPFGKAATLLLALQFVIGAKFRFLDRIFSLNRLFGFHRRIGLAALLCALAHPLIMFWPRLPEVGPFSLEFWPEMLGAAVVLGLSGAVFAAAFRERLRLPFHVWLPMHRLGMIVLALLAMIHFSFVEGHFELGITHGVLLLGLGAFVINSLANRGAMFRVNGVREVGRSTFAVDLEPEQEGLATHAPGQFALVTFESVRLPREEHPWTITSSPAKGPGLQFTVKESGDFTGRIKELLEGDRARIRGPYGLFSHLALETGQGTELVMIAGGVGVTPFLSMLRHMADVGDTRKVSLIWSNKTAEDILWREELDTLSRALPGLTVHHVLTRQTDWDGFTGRLDANLLQQILAGRSRGSHVFLCGPPSMMSSVKAELRKCDFTQEQMHTEEFHL
jgi:predicted ferric reductase